jgi:hypothetical protein
MTGTEMVWYRIVAKSNHAKFTFASGLNGDDAEALCNSFEWEWQDDNGFLWELDIEIEEIG